MIHKEIYLMRDREKTDQRVDVKNKEIGRRKRKKKEKVRQVMRFSRSLSRFETQDIKTQPQFNHNMISNVKNHTTRQ